MANLFYGYWAAADLNANDLALIGFLEGWGHTVTTHYGSFSALDLSGYDMLLFPGASDTYPPDTAISNIDKCFGIPVITMSNRMAFRLGMVSSTQAFFTTTYTQAVRQTVVEEDGAHGSSQNIYETVALPADLSRNVLNGAETYSTDDTKIHYAQADALWRAFVAVWERPYSVVSNEARVFFGIRHWSEFTATDDAILLFKSYLDRFLIRRPKPATLLHPVTDQQLYTAVPNLFDWQFDGIQTEFSLRRRSYPPQGRRWNQVTTISVLETGNEVRFSRDGAKLGITASTTGQIREVGTWSSIVSQDSNFRGISCDWNHDDSRYVVGRSSAPYLRLWETDGWTELVGEIPVVSTQTTRCVRFSPDGSMLAVACEGSGTQDGTQPIVIVYDTATWATIHTIGNFSDLASIGRALAWSPDGTLLACGLGSNRLRVLNTSDWSIALDNTSAGEANQFEFTEDGEWLVTAIRSPALPQVWVVADWTLLVSLDDIEHPGSGSNATCVAVTPDKSSVFLGSSYNATRAYQDVWDTSDWSLRAGIPDNVNTPLRCHMTPGSAPDGPLLAVPRLASGFETFTSVQIMGMTSERIEYWDGALWAEGTLKSGIQYIVSATESVELAANTWTGEAADNQWEWSVRTVNENGHVNPFQTDTQFLMTPGSPIPIPWNLQTENITGVSGRPTWDWNMDGEPEP